MLTLIMSMLRRHKLRLEREIYWYRETDRDIERDRDINS